MSTVRAAVLHECPGWLDVGDIQVDGPARNEVLVRTAAAGLCHSDLHWMEGKYTPELPLVVGHESAGVVEDVGADVTYVKPGDHVITCLSVFCGECDFCVTGRPHLCRSASVRRAHGTGPRLSQAGKMVHQLGQLGSFSEAMLVHERALVRIDPAMPLDRAALIGCSTITGVGAVFNTAKVAPGSTVAVVGCGGVGLNVIQGAILAGASRVICIDLRESKLKMARHFGATDTVDASQVDAVDAVIDLTGGGVDYSFEAIGLKVTAEQAFGMLARGGTATVIGLIPQGEQISLPGNELWMGEKHLQGSTMGSNRFRYDIPRLIDLYLQGRLKLDDLVSARITLDQVNDGFQALQNGEVVGRSVVQFPSVA